MIIPAGAKNFREAIRIGSEVFHNLKKILKEKNQQYQCRRRRRIRADSFFQQRSFGGDNVGHRLSRVQGRQRYFVALDPAASGFF